MTIIDILFPILNCFDSVGWFFTYNPLDEISQNNYRLTLDKEEYKKVMKKIKRND